MVSVLTRLLVLQNVEEELDVATESFLEGENCIVDMDRREVSHFVCCSVNAHLFAPLSDCVVFSADCLMH